MKKLFFALALLTLLSTRVFAASCDPNTDKMTNGQWCINYQDVLIPSSSAGQQVIYENYTSANTANQLLATESGKIITDTGGSTTGACLAGNGGSKHTLPRAAPGLTYTLVLGSKCTATLDTLDASDTILYSISGTLLDAGDSIKSTGQAGDSVTLTSTAANKWSVSSMKSVWTDNGTN